MTILLNDKMGKKNSKIVSAYVSEHCASFGTKKTILATFEEGGVCMSLTKNNPENNSKLFISKSPRAIQCGDFSC